MNKIHRTVWNEARQCFVVASETAKAKGKASSSRSGVVPAVAAALLALGGGQQALAADICGAGTTTISTTVASGSKCVLGNGESVSISGAGSISVTSNASADVPIQVLTTTTAAGSIVNSGLVKDTGSGTPGMLIGGSINRVSNSGTIQGNASGIAIQSAGRIAQGITNTGWMTAPYGLGLQINSTLSGGFTNSGTITASTASVFVGYNSRVRSSRT